MPNDYSMQLRNHVTGIQQISEKMTAFGTLHGLGKSLIYRANLAIEELFISIISHAHEDGRNHTIGIGFSLLDRNLTVTLEDDGKEFNPTLIPDRPTGIISLDDIEDIELGLRMVRKIVDSITYERRDGKNRITFAIEDISNRKTITSRLNEDRIYPPPEAFQKNAGIRSLEEYRAMYQQSIEHPKAFWSQQAEELNWFRKWDRVLAPKISEGIHEWFVGGKLNLTINCLDRHLVTWRKNKAAFIQEGDTPGEEKILTYQQLHRQVCRVANVLKKHGVQKGDRVSIYLPMIVELPIAMLACARIGAIHSVVFAGLSAESLRDRIQDCGSRLLICANGYTRGGRVVRCKEQADLALASCPGITDVIVVRRLDMESPMCDGRDFWWDREIGAEDIANDCTPEIMDAEDPLFILYAGGTTDKPRGVLHTTAGYLVYVMQTFKWIFDIRETDTYWCTADIGGITGHSYTVYGPLVNGATSLVFEGVPNHPGPDRFWDIIENHRVSIFHTASRALSALMKAGNDWPGKHDLCSLRLLGAFGDPVTPKVWMWYRDTIGQGRCPIVDTWGQTETGGIVISPLPGATPCKPGSATLPVFGILPEIIRQDPDHPRSDDCGWLVIKKPWPGSMRRIYGDSDRFKRTGLTRFSGVYETGIRARMDSDGYFWVMDHSEDETSITGYDNIVESAPVSDHHVAGSAIMEKPNEIVRQDIHTSVTVTVDDFKYNDLLIRLKNLRKTQALYRENSSRSPAFTYRV
ncbi:MAG: acetate--CoA ligase [Desulfatirhabdiaceae bacterium]